MNTIELMQKNLVVNDEYVDPKGNKILVVRESDVVQLVTDLLMEQYDLGVADCKKAIQETIEAAVLAEREACAKVCEEIDIVGLHDYADDAEQTLLNAAAAIRSRSENT